MKYWVELTKVEDQVIRLEEMNSVLAVFAEGIENSNDSDIRTGIWYIQGALKQINENLFDSFQELFDKVRAEDFDDDESVEDDWSVDDEEKQKFDYEELEKVINTWNKQ